MRSLVALILTFATTLGAPATAEGFRLCGWQIPGAEAEQIPRTAPPDPLFQSPGVAQLRMVFPGGPMGEDQIGHCGAVAVAPGWLLTARHCVEDHEWSRLEVSLGSRKIGSFLAGARRFGRAALCPRGTMPGSLEADIALVPIAGEIPQSVEITDIFGNPDPAGLRMPRSASLASWPTQTAEIGNPPLRDLPITAVGATPRGHIIATLREGAGHPPCGGESGAPVYVEEGGVPVLAGLLSAIITPAWSEEAEGPRCRSPQTRMLISPVAPWREWIADTIATCRAKPQSCAMPE